MALEDRVIVGRSGIHGRGLFAARRLRRGSFIGTFSGKRTQEDGMHVLWVEEEDGSQYGVLGETALRYLNHSSNPNSEFCGADLFALRNIQPGHEVTFHYGEEWEDVE